MLYKYVAKKCTEACPTGGAGFDSQALNLKNFLEFERMKDLVVGTLVYVDCDAMVTEAKEKMDKQPNCQDVIVTKTGRSDEPILGWLTNIDIARYTDA
jgi:NAD-dependent dihydropyrimidine dehydrogenase PreA subunit